MATKSTERRLQDLKAITIGKLVFATAHVYVIVDVNTTTEQYIEFFYGIATLYVKVRLYILPIIQVIKHGKNMSTDRSVSISYSSVYLL
jgi:hypothetical protein